MPQAYIADAGKNDFSTDVFVRLAEVPPERPSIVDRTIQGMLKVAHRRPGLKLLMELARDESDPNTIILNTNLSAPCLTGNGIKEQNLTIFFEPDRIVSKGPGFFSDSPCVAAEEHNLYRCEVNDRAVAQTLSHFAYSVDAVMSKPSKELTLKTAMATPFGNSTAARLRYGLSRVCRSGYGFLLALT